MLIVVLLGFGVVLVGGAVIVAWLESDHPEPPPSKMRQRRAAREGRS